MSIREYILVGFDSAVVYVRFAFVLNCSEQWTFVVECVSFFAMWTVSCVLAFQGFVARFGASFAGQTLFAFFSVVSCLIAETTKSVWVVREAIFNSYRHEEILEFVARELQCFGAHLWSFERDFGSAVCFAILVAKYFDVRSFEIYFL